MDTDDNPRPATRESRYRRRRKPLGEHAAKVIAELQRQFLNGRPNAVSSLAQLRQAIKEEPGAASVPEACWLPDALLDLEHLPSEGPSDAERALHTAVTLWSLHQQSRHEHGMHVNGTSLAAAIQRLAAGAVNEETVYERFTALGTAATYGELSHHARGLIVRLRDADIGFDYGLFVDDLRMFQRGPDPVAGLTGAERVRSLWGREYLRARPQRRPNHNDGIEKKE
ncbi:type I-E CRISPR-associated protein Cse2/CasB [Glycomyces sp. L485]|uniref:type I-E CRISPR-associated protein Cse2/CasB n=1 Tax=Glycomyces sp. L485 TaxID=2909235 RepID=UPI001F4A4A80|nr:type I-E CRISPR-associated protein Cse2/CasB [Glycomyces sp. L485]MCH7230518.1 type I-E CRISPR-associated protein Cse2/CasB [Glycomyces sp. L485]